jgi:tetrathionate reductase subunit B
MKAFLIDVGICNGCYNYQIACKDEHAGNNWIPYAKPQPDTGQFWMRLTEYIRGTVPKVKMHYISVPCQHCDDAPCVHNGLTYYHFYKPEYNIMRFIQLWSINCQSNN